MTAPVSLHEQIPTNPPKTWTLNKKEREEESHMPICLRVVIKTPSQLKRLKATQIKWQLKASYTLSALQAYHLWKLAISKATPMGNAIWVGIFSEGV